MKVAIFDIDGTLADNNHRAYHLLEEPKNWDEFFAKEHLDIPIESTKTIINNLFENNPEITIHIVTARKESSKKITEEWLNKNGILYDSLVILRKNDDFTNDDILKVKYLEKIINNGYEPIMIFEDRKRIVEALRNMNIPNCVVYHVANGNF